MMMPSIRTDKDVVKELLNEIGLFIDKQGYICDQDNFTKLTYKGKFMKFTLNNNFVKINRETEIFFNPLQNLDLTRQLFSYYIKKLETIDNRYFLTYFPLQNEDKTKNQLILKGEKENISTRYYFNLILAYTELMLKIGGVDADLSFIDSNNFRN